MADYHKNILLLTYVRSGTHLFKSMLCKELEIDDPGIKDLTDENLDYINFHFNNNKNNMFCSHIHPFEEYTPSKIDRINLIIKNRNIHVILLDRKDFKQQLISSILLQYINHWDTYKTFNKKVYIKKEWVEESYRVFYRFKYFNFNRIPIEIHEKVYYEDLIKNGYKLGDSFITKDNVLFRNSANSLNPPKNEIIKNYDKVLKWIDEYSKVYNEEWVPALRWGETIGVKPL